VVSKKVYKQVGHAKNSRPDQTGECLLNDGLSQLFHVVLRFDGVLDPLLLLHVKTGVAALERNKQVGDQQGAVFWCHLELSITSNALVASLGGARALTPAAVADMRSLLTAAAVPAFFATFIVSFSRAAATIFGSSISVAI